MLQSLIERANSGDLDAFGEIVTRFQDMAYGCACAVLGDFHLAEDATQDAFLEAYRNLPSLTEPSAFPRWFRRIVLRRCNRLTRRKSLPTEPIEAAANVPSPDLDPAAAAENREMKDKVLEAIQALPENERMATTLFYINGYSQKDIAEFLDVPVTTVNNRLHASRERLKERMVAMVEDKLKSQRPGPELCRGIVDELMDRKARFDRQARAHYLKGAPKPDPQWAAWWHERRVQDARANAAQYGIEVDETLPRMSPDYRQSETFRDDFKEVPRRWGIPIGTRLICFRDFCRQVGVTPLAAHRWEAEGLPVLRYYPWFAYDEVRSSEWVQARGIRPHEQMSAEEGREPMLLALRALAAKDASEGEALNIYNGLTTPGWRQPDPVWRDEWAACRPAERGANALRYGLAKPSRNWLGVPLEAARSRVFEIRDLSRRLGLSPFNIIQWTKEGMPCLRYSPYVRWDLGHVAAWLGERGLLPSRQYSPKELDSLEDFVVRAISDGEATPEEARDVLACWAGVM